MKKLLLCLLALLVVAPAWGGTATFISWAGVAIELKGSAESVSTLVAGLEKEAVYKDAACSTVPAKKSGKTARISCDKADSGLMDFLTKNAPATVQWSISSVPAVGKCLPGCATMHCPPPGGPVRCCNTTTYAAC